MFYFDTPLPRLNDFDFACDIVFELSRFLILTWYTFPFCNLFLLNRLF